MTEPYAAKKILQMIRKLVMSTGNSDNTLHSSSGAMAAQKQAKAKQDHRDACQPILGPGGILTKPPKTKPEQEKGNGSGELDGARPTEQTGLPDLTPLAPPPRQTPYLWRDSSPGNNVDRQGRRWTRD